MSRTLLVTSLSLLQVLFTQSANETHYRGAVVEFSPTEGNVTANIEAFIQFIEEAKKQNADIIVFPEIGLNGYGPCKDDMFTEVPHPVEKVAPCDHNDTGFSYTFQQLSLAAKKNAIYVVANLAEIAPCENEGCPSTGRHRFNTNVVLDRNGVVIARYRKYNLFGEIGTDVTPDPELSFFDTDFGVRFGTFICFDLMFDRPSLQLIKQMDITNIVFSTAWFSELPFLTAVQAQQMWAYAVNVNFLGSGYNNPQVGSAGSGIYRGRDGPLVMTFPDNSTSQLLLADLPKKPSTSTHLEPPIQTTPYKIPAKPRIYLKRENLTAYQSRALEDLASEPELCHDDFCCKFIVNYTSPFDLSPYRFRALVFNGVRTFDGYATGGVQACALVSCENENVASCGARVNPMHTFKEIMISGTFNAHSAISMPSTLQENDQLLPLLSSQFSFMSHCVEDKCNITMGLTQPVEKLTTFGIYCRNFARDGELVTTAATSGATQNIFGCLVLFSSILYLLF